MNTGGAVLISLPTKDAVNAAAGIIDGYDGALALFCMIGLNGLAIILAFSAELCIGFVTHIWGCYIRSGAVVEYSDTL